MSQEQSVDSMTNECHSFLKSKARSLVSLSRPLVFKIDNKNNLRLVDSDKKSFEVDESLIESFRDTFADKSYKYVKILNWQFSLSLDNRKCNSIELKADHVVFIANKTNKKQLKQIDFRVIVVPENQIQSLPKQTRGYVRRLIKSHILKACDNVNEQFFCLISFLRKPEPFKVQRVTNFIEQQTQQQKPMEFLNAQGKKTIEKLKNFITRQDVFDFIVRQELSSQTQKKLKDLIVASQPVEVKRKKVKVQ